MGLEKCVLQLLQGDTRTCKYFSNRGPHFRIFVEKYKKKFLKYDMTEKYRDKSHVRDKLRTSLHGLL